MNEHKLYVDIEKIVINRRSYSCDNEFTSEIFHSAKNHCEELEAENREKDARIAELEARIAELGEISDAFLMDGESAVARITALEAALTKAANRLLHVHKSPRISGAQYKVYADEVYAALKGEKIED